MVCPSNKPDKQIQRSIARFTADVVNFPLAEDDDLLKDVDSSHTMLRLMALRKLLIAATNT